MADNLVGVVTKADVTVRKWAEGRDTERDPPDKVETHAQWVERGLVVTDPIRIAELEAYIERGNTHGTR